VLQCDDLLDEMTNDELYLNAEYIKSRDTVNKLCQLAGVPAELGDTWVRLYTYKLRKPDGAWNMLFRGDESLASYLALPEPNS